MAKNPVFDYITTELTNYKTRGVPLADNWEWSMFEHIRRSFLYKNSKFAAGENDGNRPVKNIVRPVLNVAYRSEGFDVKDIKPYVNSDDDYDKSFFVEKRNETFAFEKGLDAVIDDTVESYVDYGLTLVKKVKGAVIEAVPLQRIAFCDQTDILSGPICELHHLNPDEIVDMKWDKEAVKLAIELCKSGKMVLQAAGQEAKTPGKSVEAFELNGVLPATWLNDYSEVKEGDAPPAQEYSDDSLYVRQKQIVCFYYDEHGEKQGLILFKGKVPSQIFKALKRDDIFGRACGWGGVEELFDPQQWVNYSEIQQKEMLDLASLILLQSADEALKGKNILTDVVKGEIISHEANNPVSQVSITPQNMEMFTEAVDRWNQAARTLGSADEALLGTAPAAGTPFSLQALIVQQGFGLHDYRKGQLASFWAEIYRDWILPFLAQDLKAGHKWLATLSLDEMQALSENVVNIMTKRTYIAFLTKGQVMSQQQIDAYKQQVQQAFSKGGGKKFLEILEGEISDIPLDVMVNVAGKQHDLKGDADKFTNIFRQLATPGMLQVLQVPGMAKLFNEIIEASGFSPVDFSGITTAQLAPPAPAAPQGPPQNTPQPQPSPISPQPQPVAA